MVPFATATLLASLAAASLAGARPQDPTPAEREWDEIERAVTPKLVRFQEASPEEQERITFHTEIARIGDYVRRYEEVEPDFAAAAQVFLARQILSGALQRHAEAIQLLRQVVSRADSSLVAGLAATHAAQIALDHGEFHQVAEIRRLYEERPERDAQLLEILVDLERRAALRPGQPFPDLAGEDLSGTRRSVADLRGRVVLFLVFNVEHEASRTALRQALLAHRRLAEQGAAVLAVSLDLERAKLEQELLEEKVDFPVLWDGRGWQSPLARRLGISTLPGLYVVDPEGRIQYVQVPPEQAASYVETALEVARQKKTLHGGGKAGPPGGG